MPTVRSCNDGGAVVQFHQRGIAARRSSTSVATGSLPRAQIGRDAARNDAVHHQPMAETHRRRAQHALAQHGAMRQHDAERGIVADRAEIAEVVGDPLQLRHHRRAATPRAAAARCPAPPPPRAANAKRIGDGAVARDAPGQPRSARPSVAPASAHRCPCARSPDAAPAAPPSRRRR